jgi:uncharacterized membrane protein YdfJ with MMPL/SSD domain
MNIWEKFGSFFYKFKVLTLSLVISISFVFTYFAKDLPSELKGDGFNTSGSYEDVNEILKEEFKHSANVMPVIFIKSDKTSKADFDSKISDVLDYINDTYPKADINNPLTNKDLYKDDIAYLTVKLPGKEGSKLEERTLNFSKKIKKFSTSEVTVTPTGYSVINNEMNTASQRDLAKAEMIGVPIAFLVLILSFGSIITSLIPLFIGGLSVTVTMGILYFIGKDYDLSIYVLNVAPMIGLALSIDFALLFVNRFREELLKSGDDVKRSLEITFATAGRSVVFSGICVFIGLSGLLVFDVNIFESVAIGGMTVVFISIILSLTILPAVLGLFGPKINSLSLNKFLPKTKSSNNFWRRFSKFVMKYPVAMALLATTLLVVLIIPVNDVSLKVPGIDALPKNSETRIAHEKYEDAFQNKDSASATIVLESNSSNFRIKEQLQFAEDYVDMLANDDEVSKVQSIFGILDMDSNAISSLIGTDQQALIDPALKAFIANKYMMINVELKSKPGSAEAKAWARKYEERSKTVNANVKSYVGGETKFDQEIFDEVKNKAPFGLLIIISSTFIILLIAFKSLLIPIKAIIMNFLSLSATFGFLVWLFQYGNLGIDKGNIMLILPVFIFGLVFGMSMDYEVFLISRIHEIYNETGDNDFATLEGLVSTSKIITSAASIMIVVTAAFAFTDLLPIKQIGLGIAIAIFLDATIIRMVLVPSIMKLLGDINWYLPFYKRRS